MEILLAILTGILYTAGVYMILRRSIVKFIIGIIFLGNATNLLVFLSAGITSGAPAFVSGAPTGIRMETDPLPQALVLTAIVIGFGIVVFSIALKYVFYKKTGTDDLDQLQKTDES